MRRRLLLIMIALGVGAAAPHVASAGHWNWNPQYNIIHKNNVGHLPAMSFYNRASSSWTVLEHARGDWSGRSVEFDLYNLASDGADIVAWDGRYCAPWSGIMSTYTYSGGDGTAYADGHSDQMRITLDTCDGTGSDYSVGRAVACHEIGHAAVGVFEDYFARSGGPGCMGVGYSPGYENISDPAWRSPNTHDLAHGGHLWYTLH